MILSASSAFWVTLSTCTHTVLKAGWEFYTEHGQWIGEKRKSARVPEHHLKVLSKIKYVLDLVASYYKGKTPIFTTMWGANCFECSL